MPNSFRSRLIIAFLLILTLMQLTTALFVLTATQRDYRQQQTQNLNIGSNIFVEMLSNRSEQLSQSLSLLSADFGFKRAVATGEQDTISSVLANHGRRINANAVILLSPKGKLLSSSLPGLTPENIDELFALTKNRSTSFDIFNVDHNSYQFVLQPVKAPTLIAWVGMGFTMDKVVANQAKTITGIDISFINQSGRVDIVSTLPESLQQQVLANMTQIMQNADAVSDTIVNEYLSTAIALDKNSGHQWAVLHQSNEKWQQSYDALRNNMLVIFAITCLLAFLIAAWFAGGLTRPIYALVNYARKVGQGEKPQPIIGAPAELQVLANTLSVMRENIEAREHDLVYQSQHDNLTGLYNRVAAKQQLGLLLKQMHGCIAMIDIKNFRHLNNIIGFANADNLLMLFASRLESLSPTAALISRLDGDSFLLLFQPGISREQLELYLQQLTKPYDIEGSKISVNVRVGLVELSTDYDHNDIDKLIRHAEIALNQARIESLAIATYLQGEDERYLRELMIIRDLPIAISQGQLHLVFQPKVDIHNNLCNSAETLIRWLHPQLGFIPPDEFIRLAENSGNISMISDWVLNATVKQLAQWKAQGIELKVAINLSAHDLTNAQLPQDIKQLLADHDLPIEALSIEVTEGAVMKDAQTVIAVLQQFKGIGIAIAIDDFGTGHSSLAYLKLLPVNEVKIDRSFIKDIHTDATDLMIVDTSIRLIKGLNLSVVAEGVESTEGIDILRRLDCDIVQGYVYSKPLKADDFAIWFSQFNQVNLTATLTDTVN
ncbi:putative bifunctional diguanylate cyclase/phosphodiesterase [Shewanella ulleungensis]|jgi:diguanylate cyclase (GGDEF)-like protein|uniref:GGDEF domain-containing protein n=1 Tax=Shewanella ulleungensis TaxID=2282699 RepID=A0ABQ2QVR0_9GAMM|nr:GGDEF domain-containing phosphodiesterase [Shewanella ulleungensis]MCL1151236.1 EAL domain-containing protein [Shewanella ulleungensis]GGP96519.1 GGDEF domain-containing protein [Shewanella ulleungensis]